MVVMVTWSSIMGFPCQLPLLANAVQYIDFIAF